MFKNLSAEPLPEDEAKTEEQNVEESIKEIQTAIYQTLSCMYKAVARNEIPEGLSLQQFMAVIVGQLIAAMYAIHMLTQEQYDSLVGMAYEDIQKMLKGNLEEMLKDPSLSEDEANQLRKILDMANNKPKLN